MQLTEYVVGQIPDLPQAICYERASVKERSAYC